MPTFSILPALDDLPPDNFLGVDNDWMKTIIPEANAATPLRIDEAVNADTSEKQRLLQHHSGRALDETIPDLCRALLGQALWQKVGNPNGISMQSVIADFRSDLHYRIAPALAAYEGTDRLQQMRWYATWQGVFRLYTAGNFDPQDVRQLLRELVIFLCNLRGSDTGLTARWEEAHEYLSS